MCIVWSWSTVRGSLILCFLFPLLLFVHWYLTYHFLISTCFLMIMNYDKYNAKWQINWKYVFMSSICRFYVRIRHRYRYRYSGTLSFPKSKESFRIQESIFKCFLFSESSLKLELLLEDVNVSLCSISCHNPIPIHIQFFLRFLVSKNPRQRMAGGGRARSEISWVHKFVHMYIHIGSTKLEEGRGEAGSFPEDHLQIQTRPETRRNQVRFSCLPVYGDTQVVL